MEWDDLRFFLAIARHGSLSAAGRALRVRQSTVGRRLAALESEVGARLFQRTPSGFVPTAAGEAVLGNVERIETEALAVERIVTGRDVGLEGSVRLTSVETLAVEMLTPSFAAFRRRYSRITLELVADTRSLSLTKREADVALRMAPLAQNDLAVRKLGEMAVAIYASSAYLERRGIPDFAAGAPGHDVLLVHEELMSVPDMAWFHGLTREAGIAFRSNSRFALRAAALAEMGLVCLARYLGDDSGLQRLAVPGAPRRDIWLAVHNDARRVPRIRALTEFLAEEMRRLGERLCPKDAI
jgi:DNA-binding transcriptional LysR family regulator